MALPGNSHEKPRVDALLAGLGYAGTERAETLDLRQHLQLCETFRPAGGEGRVENVECVDEPIH